MSQGYYVNGIKEGVWKEWYVEEGSTIKSQLKSEGKYINGEQGIMERMVHNWCCKSLQRF